ncbi:MAG: Gfo/Idh/MocA family oxidoreductase [Oscillospiraceae bacterium]|jgi:predicted dehydrogenase|nr:Gfo/Idh/MocA family oxidoreductase [Oscillospiraceae bacterium]
MRYCLIGCGRVAPEHIRAAQHNGLELAGLCDVDPGRRAENLSFAADVLRDVPFFTDHRAMLREAKPALTAIATPSGLHAAMALDCIEAGSHVIIEKPIAMHLADAEQIQQAAQRQGVVVGNNLQNRFNPAVCALRKAVEEGRFGRILSATFQLRWWRGAEYYSQAAWRGTRALDGGAMMNQSIHGIDLLNWMLGSCPETITALKSTLLHTIECEDIGVAALRYRHGALATLECMTVAYPAAQEETLQINGTKGCARLGGTAGHTVELWRFDDAAPGEEAEMRRRYSVNPASVYGHGHSLLYADVCDAIAQRRPPLVGVTEGANALSIILAAYRSAESGRPVRFHSDETIGKIL